MTRRGRKPKPEGRAPKMKGNLVLLSHRKVSVGNEIAGKKIPNKVGLIIWCFTDPKLFYAVARGLYISHII